MKPIHGVENNGERIGAKVDMYASGLGNHRVGLGWRVLLLRRVNVEPQMYMFLN